MNLLGKQPNLPSKKELYEIPLPLRITFKETVVTLMKSVAIAVVKEDYTNIDFRAFMTMGTLCSHSEEELKVTQLDTQAIDRLIELNLVETDKTVRSEFRLLYLSIPTGIPVDDHQPEKPLDDNEA